MLKNEEIKSQLNQIIVIRVIQNRLQLQCARIRLSQHFVRKSNSFGVLTPKLLISSLVKIKNKLTQTFIFSITVNVQIIAGLGTTRKYDSCATTVYNIERRANEKFTG